MLYSKRPVRFPLEDEILPNKNIIYTNPNGNFANSLGDYHGQDDEVPCIMKGSSRACILRSDSKQKEILNNLTMVYSGDEGVVRRCRCRGKTARVLIRTKTCRGWTVRVLYDQEYDNVTSDVCVYVCVNGRR